MGITRMLRPPCTSSIHLVSSSSSSSSRRLSQSHKATSLKHSPLTSQPQPLLPPSPLSAFTSTFGRLLNSLKPNPSSNLHPQMLIQKAIVDCRFLTLFAVLGSLLASLLCFIEGCSLVIQSYAQCFHIWSNRLDRGHVAKLLIEAIDMFLVGTGMLIFGVGLYVMFVGSKTEQKPWLHGRDSQSTPRWVGIESIGEAKSKIGHAVMLILQVGVVDKLKDIPMVTGLDLACFAAAIFTSSASIFLLSRLHR
ncbi:hypothetical protein K1719_015885 [Acacia pycnantha]|nr:hypothetical protein K1719_015885 [Acacia pycnantha]